MSSRRPALLVFLFCLCITRFCFGQQAPAITYPDPPVYTAGSAITPLNPNNSGGVVPPNIYSQVTTFVGSVGVFGSMDGNGTGATISSPFGLAIGADGSTLFFADYNNSVVRKVTASGDVTTFAGEAHTRGFVDAKGTNAQFSDPSGIVITKAGVAYVTDYYNNMVRKIAPDGTVTSVAGLAGQRGTADGNGTDARFFQPAGIAISPTGDIYVSDTENNEIRKVLTDGTVTTFAGNSAPGFINKSGKAASFYQPQGLVFDSFGNLYVADAGNNVIRKITPAGDVTTFAGSGTAGAADGSGTAASFNGPLGITIDQAGNFYVADKVNNLIRKITPAGLVSTFAGSGAGNSMDGIGLAASFGYPGSAAVDNNGNLFVGDLSNFVIRKVALTGYTIDKPLPRGLVFDQKTGTISGKPIFTSPNTTYTITAYNIYGSSSTTLTIQVKAKAMDVLQPPVISYQSINTYTAYQPIVPLRPNNSGGAVPANNYGQVSTVAGNNTVGNTNGPGTSANFNGPSDVVFDSAGNLFVTESGNNDVRKISPAGIVSTFAVTEQQINGPPKPAFISPSGITTDPGDNIYVADKDDQMIKQITPSGLITTYAGNGDEATFDGPALSASFTDPFDQIFDAAGNLYVVDRGNSRLREIDISGQVTTLDAFDTNNDPDTNLDDDIGFMAIDPQANLYISYLNHIIKVNTVTTAVTTFAGSDDTGFKDGNSSTARFDQPYGLARDAAGNIYVGDAGNNAIRKITAQGNVTTVAGNGTRGAIDGQAATATFSGPLGVALDNAGDFLYVADSGNGLIRKIAVTGYTIDKQLPAGLSFEPATGTITGTPTAAAPATVYTVTAYNASGSSVSTFTISVNNGTLAAPNISYLTPQVYVTGKSITPLQPVNTGGAVPATIYGQVSTYATGNQSGGGTNDSFDSVFGITYDVAGDIFICDALGNAVRRLSPNGMLTLVAGGNQGHTDGIGSAASFSGPTGITFNANGDLYVADVNNDLIRKVTQGGSVTSIAGTSQTQGSMDGRGSSANFSLPTGLIFDAAGNIFVADFGNNSIRKIDNTALVSTFAGGTGGNKNGIGNTAQFKAPYGIAIDASGNIYFSDQGNELIKKMTPDAAVTSLAGSGSPGNKDGLGSAAAFNNPTGIFIDRAGNLFVADGSNFEVRRVSPAGLVTTIAGNGISGRTDGIGTAASFSFLSGITGDGNGTLYVADRDNNLIRKITVTGYTIDKPLPEGLTFDPTTGIISGTPTVVSPATDYTVAAYNVAGSSTTIVNIEIRETNTIVFGPLPVKTVCDADFDPGATGAKSITYSSDNSSVATILNNLIHITGPGTAIINATNGSDPVMQTLTVTAAITPAVSIALQGGSSCQTTAPTYSASSVGGGTTPAYTWKINGVSQQDNTPVFSSNNIVSGDVVTCTLTSSEACTTSPSAESNQLIYTPIPAVITAVTISSSASGPICSGTTVTFEAMPVNEGAEPFFQWQVNGINSGENSPVFNTNSLKNGDVVSCILTSSVECVTNLQVVSNVLTTELSPVSNCVINIPNTFTPNGDGFNDKWTIDALQAYKNCRVSIFTRYGRLIYNSIGYPIAWDGTFKGSAVPVGTYYYVIDLKNGAKPLSGFIAVLK